MPSLSSFGSTLLSILLRKKLATEAIRSTGFFSATRFPAVIQPLVRALPLTAAIDALRSNMLQGIGLNHLLMPMAILLGWLVAPFAVHHPNSAGWYFVTPDTAHAARKVVLFRQWVMAEAALTQAQLDLEISGGLAAARAAIA